MQAIQRVVRQRALLSLMQGHPLWTPAGGDKRRPYKTKPPRAHPAIADELRQVLSGRLAIRMKPSWLSTKPSSHQKAASMKP